MKSIINNTVLLYCLLKHFSEQNQHFIDKMNHKLHYLAIPLFQNEIGDRSFEKCSLLKGILIPSSLFIISHSAFSECTSLAQIMIPSSMTHNMNYTFMESLVEILIPSSVSKIKNLLSPNNSMIFVFNY